MLKLQSKQDFWGRAKDDVKFSHHDVMLSQDYFDSAFKIGEFGKPKLVHQVVQLIDKV